MLKQVIGLFISAWLLTQCTEVVKPTEAEIGRDYFPLAVGNSWVYDVTETKYANQPQKKAGDSITYQIREKVTDTFIDQAGQTTYKVTRSRRTAPNKEWGQDSLILINPLPSSILVTRNNLKTVNLVFPIISGKSWNGNAFNNRGVTEFTYDGAGNPFSVNGTMYAQTVTVIQAYDKNIINFDDQQEVYAQGVGLIYKRFIDYNYCDGSAGQGTCPFDAEFIVKGIKKIQKLRSFESGK